MNKLLLLILSLNLYSSVCDYTLPPDFGTVSQLISENGNNLCPSGTVEFYQSAIESFTQNGYLYAPVLPSYPFFNGLNEQSVIANYSSARGQVTSRVEHVVSYYDIRCASNANNPGNLDTNHSFTAHTFSDCISADTYVDLNTTVSDSNSTNPYAPPILGDSNSTIGDQINNNLYQNTELNNSLSNIDSSINSSSTLNDTNLNKVNDSINSNATTNDTNLNNINNSVNSNAATNNTNLNNINTNVVNSAAANDSNLKSIKDSISNSSIQNSSDISSVVSKLSSIDSQNKIDLSNSSSNFDTATSSAVADFSNYQSSVNNSLDFSNLSSYVKNISPTFSCSVSTNYSFSIFGTTIDLDTSFFLTVKPYLKYGLDFILVLTTFFVYKELFEKIINLVRGV